ncbi:MAG: hypothetical protein ACFFDE_08120 [Promethearchaeota archaeon]
MLLGEDLSEDKIIKRVGQMYDDKMSALKRWYDLIDYRRERYNLEHYPEQKDPMRTKPAYEEHITLASEMRLVNKAQDLLTAGKLRISAKPEEETEPGLEQADRLESWLEGVLYENKLRQGSDPVRLAIHDMLVTGFGCLSAVWDTRLDPRLKKGQGEEGEETWKYDEGAKLRELPIIVLRKDPRKMLPHPGATPGGWLWIMYVEDLPVSDVEAEWGVTLKDAKAKGEWERFKDTVKVYDVWTWEQNPDPESGQHDLVVCNTVIAGEEIVKEPSVMENYTRLPFVIFSNREAPSEKFEHRFQPITAPIERAVTELESAWSAIARQIKITSNLPWVWRGEGTPPEIELGYDPDNVLYLRKDDDFGFPQSPGNPPDAFRAAEMFQIEVDAGSLGAPLSAEAGASTSGYALALRGQAGTLSLNSPSEALSLGMTQVLQLICDLAAGFAPDHDMRVRAWHENQRRVFALKGSELKGWLIDVEVSAKFPEDTERKMAQGITMSQMPPEQRPLDDRTILEKLMGFENATEIMERKMVERFQANPMIQELLMQEALIKRGLERLLQGGAGAPAPEQPGMDFAGSPRAPTMPVEGIPTQEMPQEMLGAMRQQEFGFPPGNQPLPEEEFGPIAG